MPPSYAGHMPPGLPSSVGRTAQLRLAHRLSVTGKDTSAGYVFLCGSRPDAGKTRFMAFSFQPRRLEVIIRPGPWSGGACSGGRQKRRERASTRRLIQGLSAQSFNAIFIEIAFTPFAVPFMPSMRHLPFDDTACYPCCKKYLSGSHVPGMKSAGRPPAVRRLLWRVHFFFRRKKPCVPLACPFSLSSRPFFSPPCPPVP